MSTNRHEEFIIIYLVASDPYIALVVRKRKIYNKPEYSFSQNKLSYLI